MTRKTRTIDGGPKSETERERTPDRPEAAGPTVPQPRLKSRRAGQLQAVLELFTVFPAKD